MSCQKLLLFMYNYLFSVCSETKNYIRIRAGALVGLRKGEVRQWHRWGCQVFAQGPLDVSTFTYVLGPLWPTGNKLIFSRVGEYLRYSSERYRRYRGSQYLIFILDTFLGSQYLICIFRYFTMKKIRYFHTYPCWTEEAHFCRNPIDFCSIWHWKLL